MENSLEREIYRMTFLGSCNSGKTTIINSLVNNNFINSYEPTYSIEIYETEFEIDNKENSLFSSKSKKDIVELIIEDTFGLNNYLIQAKTYSINSDLVREQRNQMLEYLKDVLLSSKKILEAVQEADFHRERGENIFTSERNNQTQSNINMLTNESHLSNLKNNKKITSLLNLKNGLPRTALIFVVDINNEHSLAETISILSRIKEVEKEELYKTEKVVLLNKYDKSSEGKKVNNIESKLDKFGVSYYYVSALTGFNIQKAFNNLILSLRRKYYALSDN